MKMCYEVSYCVYPSSITIEAGSQAEANQKLQSMLDGFTKEQLLQFLSRNIGLPRAVVSKDEDDCSCSTNYEYLYNTILY